MSARKKICILGGGISGLTAAYELSKNHDVTLIEKKKAVGGWIETEEEGAFFFEKGPRTFPTRRSEPLLQLVQELGQIGELIPAAPDVKRRYIWHQGKLELVPTSPLSAVRSPLTKGLLSHLLFKEWRIPASDSEETIWEFAKRRLGHEAADLLFDPLVKGVFGGDAKQLSIEASFPFLKTLETEHGSLIKGMLKRKRKRKSPPEVLKRSSLFTFRSGVKALVNALQEQMLGEVALEESVLKLEYLSGKWEILTNKRSLQVDIIVSALPAFVLGELFKTVDAPLSVALKSIPYAGLTLVHLGWEKPVLKNKGFGYLVPTCEKEKALGAIFDSSIFPQHNRGALETRLTVLFPEGVDAPEEAAYDTIAKHLGVYEKPSFVKVSKAPSAIPQYRLGHIETVESIRQGLQERFPTCFLVGSYLKGVSVSDCVLLAQLVAKKAEQVAKEDDDPSPESRGCDPEGSLDNKDLDTLEV